MNFKKFIVLTLTILLISAPAYASSMMVLHKASELNVYRGTVTGITFSAVDGGVTESGGAFVDNLPQAVLDLIALYPGALSLEAYDSAGRMLKGVLKAAGSAEGLTAEKVDAWTNLGSDPYETFTPGVGSDITSAINTSGYAVAYKSTSVSSGMLLKLAHNLTLNSGTLPSLRLSGDAGHGLGIPSIIDILSAGNVSAYKTATADFVDVGYWNNTPTNFSMAGFSYTQVLTPSTSGATIVSAKAGDIFNFAYNGWIAGSYNAASYFCIVRKLR